MSANAAEMGAVVVAPANRGTAGDDIVRSWNPSVTKSSMILTEDAGAVRGRVSDLGKDVHETHNASQSLEWRVRTTQRVKEAATELLQSIADLGFSWRGIAQLVGVTVPSVQKWRRGDRVAGENRQSLASLAAACDLLGAHYYVDDIAAWFETPLTSAAPITPSNFWIANRQDLLFEYASGYADPEHLLTEFDEDWRDRYGSTFEVVTGGDGLRSIQAKD